MKHKKKSLESSYLRYSLLSISFLLCVASIQAQQIQELFLGLKQVTTAERTGIDPANLIEGMMVIDSSDHKVYYWDGTEWIELKNTVSEDISDSISVSYPNAIFNDPGGATTGCMNTINTGSSNNFLNAFTWDTSETTAQNYEIIIRYKVPKDFIEVQTNWFTIQYSSAISSSISLTIVKEDNSPIFNTTTLTPATGAGSFSPFTISSAPITELNSGDMLVITLRLTSTDTASAGVSDISFNYTN